MFFSSTKTTLSFVVGAISAWFENNVITLKFELEPDSNIHDLSIEPSPRGNFLAVHV